MRFKMIFYCAALLTTLVIAYILDIQTGFTGEDWGSNVAVEFHGLIFDIILFGILLTIFEEITSKRRDIKRYKEELDDFRQWKSEESQIRILGIIRRLINLSYHRINLSLFTIDDKRIEDWIIRPQLTRKAKPSDTQWTFKKKSFVIRNFSLNRCSLHSCRFRSLFFSDCKFSIHTDEASEFSDCGFYRCVIKVGGVLEGRIIKSSFYSSEVSCGGSRAPKSLEPSGFFEDCLFREVNLTGSNESNFTNCSFHGCWGLDILDKEGNYNYPASQTAK